MSDDQVTVYHDPNCSRSRAVVALLDEHEADYRLRTYLVQPLCRDELEQLLKKLGTDDPRVVMRTGDDRYAELGLIAANRETLITTLLQDPQLLQSPIAVRRGRALVAWPLERVLDLLGDDEDEDEDGG